MLSKILGVIWIILGLWWVVKPEALKNRLKRKMSRKVRWMVFIFVIIFACSMIGSVLKVSGLLPKIVGIIGPNGSGKSTLLKILSRITPPSSGKIKLIGSVGSLLEVGTGFHPELSGKENVYLNGAILGMAKKKIDEQYDKIYKH